MARDKEEEEEDRPVNFNQKSHLMGTALFCNMPQHTNYYSCSNLLGHSNMGLSKLSTRENTPEQHHL